MLLFVYKTNKLYLYLFIFCGEGGCKRKLSYENNIIPLEIDFKNHKTIGIDKSNEILPLKMIQISVADFQRYSWGEGPEN